MSAEISPGHFAMSYPDLQIPESQLAQPRLFGGRIGFWLAMVFLVTIFAGLAFGYDQGVIGGALSFIEADFGFGDFMEGLITSAVTLGALVGALAGGPIADRFGRKHTLALAAVLFIAGGLIQAVSPDVEVLILGRVVIGLGVGIASVAAPLYAAEMAPAASRGRFVSAYQLAITIGILAAQFADLLFTDDGEWRAMLGLAAIPGVLLLATVIAVPDSARWLVKVGRRDDARESWTKVRGSWEVDAALDRIQADLSLEQVATWGELLAKGARRALYVGCGLAVFQQVTGINAIIYYSDRILAEAGFETQQAQADASLVAVGLVNVLATFIAIAFVDRLGRRPLLFAGLTGMFVGLIGLTIAFLFDSSSSGGESVQGILAIVSMVVFIASFAFSLGPVVWTIISEIYPNRIRGKAMSVATAVNWAAAFALALLFPDLLDWLGASATFGLLAGMTVIGFLWMWRNVPETRGKSLEEISELWRSD